MVSLDIQLAGDPPELNPQSSIMPSLSLPEEHLPEILVLDISARAGCLSVVYPAASPLGGTFSDVFRVGGKDQRAEALAYPVTEMQYGENGLQFGVVAGLAVFASKGAFVFETPGYNACRGC